MKDYLIRKIRSKKKDKYIYEYYDKDKHKISSKKALSLIPKIYIAPAYDNVKISLNPKSKVLAIGEDLRGRKQYIYHQTIIKKHSNQKFRKLITLGKIYPKIIRKINHDSKQNDDIKLKHIATVIRIIIDCNFRVGNKIYENENKSYGVTTLKKKHLTLNKGNIVIEFNGKKNVTNKCKLTHKQTIRNLKEFQKSKSSQSKLFSYQTDTGKREINSNDINQYLQDFGDYTSKNIRTWRANMILIKTLLKHISLKDSILKVSNMLHNTTSVCKQNYLDPKLIQFYESKSEDFIQYFKNNISNKYIAFLKKSY